MKGKLLSFSAVWAKSPDSVLSVYLHTSMVSALLRIFRVFDVFDELGDDANAQEVVCKDGGAVCCCFGLECKLEGADHEEDEGEGGGDARVVLPYDDD